MALPFLYAFVPLRHCEEATPTWQSASCDAMHRAALRAAGKRIPTTSLWTGLGMTWLIARCAKRTCCKIRKIYNRIRRGDY